MIENLEAALVAAFPPVVIDRSMIYEPSAMWELQDDRDALAAFEGKTWTELPDELLYRNTGLLIWAGETFWQSLLAASLSYLLRDHDLYNDLPHQVAGELTRGERESTQKRFDRRMVSMSAQQRAVVLDVVTTLSTKRLMETPMLSALVSLNSV